MNRSEFVYVTYIRTTPQKLWDALTTPEFQKQYWFGAYATSVSGTATPPTKFRGVR
jgi:uncharacterized protein YndB with AHSA1/START domain